MLKLYNHQKLALQKPLPVVATQTTATAKKTYYKAIIARKSDRVNGD